MEEKDKYISFYDQFTSDPKKNEISVLHVHILEKLIIEGLRSNHKVLEAGCGLGELSHLIAQKVKHGKVLGVDINEDTVKKASQLWEKQKNLSFEKAEMKAFENHGETYDFIILSEILQQISRDKHYRLFERVRHLSQNGTTIFVNLPSPRFSEWKAQNDPESLQFVESIVNVGAMIESATANGFFLEKVASYSVFFEENDFQYFIFRPQSRVVSPMPKKKRLFSKEKLHINLMSLLM